jgi:hypothetical protein
VVSGEGSIRSDADLTRTFDDEDDEGRALQLSRARFELGERRRAVASSPLRRIDEEASFDEGQIVVTRDLERPHRDRMV